MTTHAADPVRRQRHAISDADATDATDVVNAADATDAILRADDAADAAADAVWGHATADCAAGIHACGQHGGAEVHVTVWGEYV